MLAIARLVCSSTHQMTSGAPATAYRSLRTNPRNWSLRLSAVEDPRRDGGAGVSRAERSKVKRCRESLARAGPRRRAARPSPTRAGCPWRPRPDPGVRPTRARPSSTKNASWSAATNGVTCPGCNSATRSTSTLTRATPCAEPGRAQGGAGSVADAGALGQPDDDQFDPGLVDQWRHADRALADRASGRLLPGRDANPGRRPAVDAHPQDDDGERRSHGNSSPDCGGRGLDTR